MTRARKHAIIGTIVAACVVVAVLAWPRGGGAAKMHADAAGSVGPTGLEPQQGTAVDPQPIIECRLVTMTLNSTAPDDPATAALMQRLGGAGAEVSGLVPVEGSLGSSELRSIAAGAPGLRVAGVSTVVNHGGEWATLTLTWETTDPTTGLVLGRTERQVTIRVTALASGRLGVEASLVSELDSTALEVLGRRAGVPMGESEHGGGMLVLEAGENAALRVVGETTQIVFIEAAVQPAVETPPG